MTAQVQEFSALDASLALVDFTFIATRIFAPSRGRKVGITRGGLAKMIERGDFPKPLKVAGHGQNASVRWRLAEILEWIDAREKAR